MIAAIALRIALRNISKLNSCKLGKLRQATAFQQTVLPSRFFQRGFKADAALWTLWTFWTFWTIGTWVRLWEKAASIRAPADSDSTARLGVCASCAR